MSTFFRDAVELPRLPDGYGVQAWSVAEPDEVADQIWVDVDYANGFRTQSSFSPDEARRVAQLLLTAAAAVDQHNTERTRRLAMQEAASDGFLDNADPDMDAAGADDYLADVAQ